MAKTKTLWGLGIGMLFSGLVFAAPMGPPAGVPILNQSQKQTGAVFNVSSGTVDNLYTSTMTARRGIYFGDGTFQTTASSGGAGSFAQLSDVDDSARAINLVPKCCVSGKIVWANYDATFSFGIASFSDGLSGTQEIGSGVWKSAGAISFSASYSNGPPTGSTITASGWSPLPLSSPFTSATSVASVNYPSVSGTVVFNLSAKKGTETAAASITHTFVNRVYYGVSSVGSGYTAGNVTGLASSNLQDSRALTFTVNPGASQYIIYAFPTRLGTATFSVGGFEGGFMPPETVSVTNGSGYTENYYVYRSANSNLGSTTVVVN